MVRAVKMYGILYGAEWSVFLLKVLGLRVRIIVLVKLNHGHADDYQYSGWDVDWLE